MELKDTIEMMTSDDYKERFKAEYHQLKIRHEKLKVVLNKWEAEKSQEPTLAGEIEGFLGFYPSCSFELIHKQFTAMGEYLHCLEVRALIEHIDLD